MSPLILLRVALVALLRHKLRSSLTILGIVVGVGAVICAVSIGDGAATRIRRSIESLGANMVWVEAGGVNANGVRTGNNGARSLKVDDVLAIRDTIDLVTHASPSVDARVQVIYGNQNWNTQVRGVSDDYLNVRQWPLARGVAYNDDDIAHARRVCVLGQAVAARLFDESDPVGATIRVRNVLVEVLGVLDAKGAGPGGQNQDDVILMPYTTVMRQLTGQTWLDDAYFTAASTGALTETEDAIVGLMRERHRIQPGQPDDFNVRHPVELAQAAEASATAMETMLGEIASVSLLVGGIGVMNIMLVSVSERTREIGLRLSIGARARDVRRQFLTEAILLSVAGGLLGIATGVFASDYVSEWMGWETNVSTGAVGLAFTCAAAIGVGFGYYPAAMASALDPIEALRHE